MAQIWLVISTLAIAKLSFPLDLSSDYGSEFSWRTPGWSCLLYFTIQSGAYPGWFSFFTSQFLMIISNLLATSQCWFVQVLYNPPVLPFPMVFCCFFCQFFCVNSPLMHSWTHPAKRWGERSPPLVGPGVPGTSLKNAVAVSPIKNVKKKTHLLGYTLW